MSDHYERWNETDCVETFAAKAADDFFPSEVHHLKKIISQIRSVLDVGCASGKFIDLLQSLGATPSYVGLDIGLSNIENAQRLYPNSQFHHMNALEFTSDQTFDLVNATGVCQHEPDFERLIQAMAKLSNKYVLFDVKFSKTNKHIVDLAVSHAGTSPNKLYFIILNIETFIEFLKKIDRICAISIFGYQTPLNNRTQVPEGIHTVVSAGILLTLSDPDQPCGIHPHPKIDCTVPEGLV